MTPPESDTPLMPSAHDHGNCELSDWQEKRIEALERELAARKGYVLEWISVSERLPMIGNVVLVGSTGEFMREPTMAFRGINNEAWVNAGDTADFEQADITHWMPLPAAPSATNEEGKS